MVPKQPRLHRTSHTCRRTADHAVGSEIDVRERFEELYLAV